MVGLVHQLQADALDQSVKVTDLLRKAKVTASKLVLSDFAEWVNCELNGYDEDSSIPEYREIRGRVKFRNPYQGWMPVIFNDEQYEAKFTTRRLIQSIGSLETAIDGSRDSGFLAFPLTGEAHTILARNVGFETEYQIHFSLSQANSVLDAVRNRILDWSLELEQRGITGNEISFSQNEKKAAEIMRGSTVYSIQNVGILGDVSKSNVQSNQITYYNDQQFRDICESLDEIENAFTQMGEELRVNIEPNVISAREELARNEPDSNRLRTALSSIKAACESAGGSLIATGIAGLLSRFL